MSETERIMLECRYLLSLNKSYLELANTFKVSVDTIYNDLNNKLPKIDSILYERIAKKIKNNK